MSGSTSCARDIDDSVPSKMQLDFCISCKTYFPFYSKGEKVITAGPQLGARGWQAPCRCAIAVCIQCILAVLERSEVFGGPGHKGRFCGGPLRPDPPSPQHFFSNPAPYTPLPLLISFHIPYPLISAYFPTSPLYFL